VPDALGGEPGLVGAVQARRRLPAARRQRKTPQGERSLQPTAGSVHH
jgi:hypothetical protein